MNTTTDNKLEKVIIVGLNLNKKGFDIDKSMDELKALVEAAGGEVETIIIQNRDRINNAHYIGKGKAEEIKNYAYELDIDTIVFNDELSGSQMRNLEKIIDKKIIDRTNLILDIFALRANTKEGKLQVELAQLKYRLPRLVGYRDYLSRPGGGIGTRGPGEQQLETDRRHILREINNIEKKLKDAKEVRQVKRKQRLISNRPLVSLVGYTNAGKSTIMNGILKLSGVDFSDKSVFVKDMLFATLDTSLRKVKFSEGEEFLLSDTVGFVSKLPTMLVEAFKGTLEEIEYSDLILLVIDGSSDSIELQVETTNKILKDLDVTDKPILKIFNKMDLTTIENLQYFDKDIKESLFISAKNENDIKELLLRIKNILYANYYDVFIKIPFNKYEIMNYFSNNYEIKNCKHTNEGTEFTALIDEKDKLKYSEYICDKE